MRHCHFSIAVFLLLSLVGGASLYAQLPAAQLNGVFPMAARPGDKLDVVINGADLDGTNADGVHPEAADQLVFSHAGITAKQKTREPTAVEVGPQIVPNAFTVTVAANVTPGFHEVRAVGKYGVSNPRVFVVDAALPQVVETEEPNNDREKATPIQPPTAVVGQLKTASDVDCFKFTAAAGQRILVDCQARRIDSLLDAVVTVFDPLGREVGSSRDGQSGDPLVDFTAGAAGEYCIEVHDSVYRGGSDYFYRLRVGPLPHIDFVFPPAGKVGGNAMTVYGRNLPGGKPAGVQVNGRPLESVTVNIAIPAGAVGGELALDTRLDAETLALDGIEYRIKGPAGESNPFLVAVARAPVVLEKEPNNDPAAAQKITVPCELAGQFYPSRDEDWITLDAKAGDVLAVEVISQRLGLPTDPQLIVQQVTKTEQGEEQVKQLAVVDDSGSADGGPAFDTRSDDPVYRFTAPADGTYRMLVRDFGNSADNDPRRVYRLVVRPEQPDFRLAAAPGDSGALLLRKGGSAELSVVAFRRDGFDGEITVTATGLPAGVTCPPVVIGPAREGAALVLTAAENAAPGIGNVQISGRATIAGKQVTRTARTGVAVWPVTPRQNINQQIPSVEARRAAGITVAVSPEEAPYTVAFDGGKVWETSRAGTLKIPYTVARRGNFKAVINTVPVGLPPNIDRQALNINPNQNSGEFTLNLKNNTPTGTYTLYLSGFAQAPYSRNPEALEAAKTEQQRLVKLVQETAAAAKKAADEKTAADKASADADAAAKKATNDKAAADKALADAQTALKAATDESAQAAAAAKAKPEDKGLADAAAAAQKAVADAQAKVKQAETAVAAAQKTLEEAQAKAKTAAEAKTVAEQKSQEAAALAKMAADAKTAADQRVNNYTNASKPNNRNISLPSTTFTIKITDSPIVLVPPKATPLKQGEKLEVPLSIQRLYEYAEQVNFNVTVPGGVGGLSIPNVSIPKGQNAAKLAITAAANATPGTHELLVRATFNVNNQQLTVEQPLALTVQAVEPPANK